MIFFPPGCARDADASGMLAAGGVDIGPVTLRKGAEIVEIGGVALPTGARSPDRPVALRLTRDDGMTSCRILPRPPVPLPGTDALFAADTIAGTSGIAMEFIATDLATSPILPRGLRRDAARAGAVDHVSVWGGIKGWLVDLARPAPHAIELRCGDTRLATTLADRPRPATAPLADRAPLGRFSIPWADVDRAALATCQPDTPVIAHVPALNARLDDAYRPLSARTALALMGQELTLPPAPRHLAPSSDVAGPWIAPGVANVTAIIPNYNYAHYLPQRIATLIAPDIGLILLDDASTDDSIAVARRAAPGIGIVTSAQNSGAVLPQWRRAANLAETPYLLIAEADDIADPALVPTLAALLDANPNMAFAFADSAQIDAAGTITRADHQAYYAALGDRALEHDQVIPAEQFLLRFLLPRNLVVNVSAILWRTATLRAAFARLGDEIDRYRAAGDWRVYIEACRTGGTIGYTPRVLNLFRRHPGSVIAHQQRDRHLHEVAAIHAHLLALVDDDANTAERLAHHRATLRRLWSVDAESVDASGDPA